MSDLKRPHAFLRFAGPVNSCVICGLEDIDYIHRQVGPGPRDAEERQGRYVVEHVLGDNCWRLMDTVSGTEAGRDGGEPEDQLLLRDWSWVVTLLNKHAACEASLAKMVEHIAQALAVVVAQCDSGGYDTYRDVARDIIKALRPMGSTS